MADNIVKKPAPVDDPKHDKNYKDLYESLILEKRLIDDNIENTTNNNNDISDLQKLTYKQYIGGQTYNGVTLTVTVTGGTLTRGIFIPYQTIDGQWRLRFNYTLNRTAAAIAPINVTGILGKNIASYFQAISGNGVSGQVGSGEIYPNSNRIDIYTVGNDTNFCGSGDVEIESKPTWAD